MESEVEKDKDIIRPSYQDAQRNFVRNESRDSLYHSDSEDEIFTNGSQSPEPQELPTTEVDLAMFGATQQPQDSPDAGISTELITLDSPVAQELIAFEQEDEDILVHPTSSSVKMRSSDSPQFEDDLAFLFTTNSTGQQFTVSENIIDFGNSFFIYHFPEQKLVLLPQIWGF